MPSAHCAAACTESCAEGAASASGARPPGRPAPGGSPGESTSPHGRRGGDDKSRMGNWGVDAIIGAADQGLLVSAVDRKSKFRCLLAVANKTKTLVGAALVTLYEQVKERGLRITSDNGKEFATHCELGAALGVEVYFARPYDSKERELSEDTTGLAGRYFPKGTSLQGPDLDRGRQVSGLLNWRTRKALSIRR